MTRMRSVGKLHDAPSPLRGRRCLQKSGHAYEHECLAFEFKILLSRSCYRAGYVKIQRCIFIVALLLPVCKSSPELATKILTTILSVSNRIYMQDSNRGASVWVLTLMSTLIVGTRRAGNVLAPTCVAGTVSSLIGKCCRKVGQVTRTTARIQSSPGVSMHREYLSALRMSLAASSPHWSKCS